MWRWALYQSRTRRARRAAGAVISPMVEQSRRRLGEIPDVAWSDPYIVGLTVMMITIVARIEAGLIDGQSLCRVQVDAWQDITERSDMIGEELVLLSAAHNRDFEAGCCDAMALGKLLSLPFASDVSGYLRDGTPEYLPDNLQELELDSAVALYPHADLSAVWEQFFDPHVAKYSRSNI